MSRLSAPPEADRVALLCERADFYGGGQRSLLELAVYLRRTRLTPCAILPAPGALAEALAAHGIEVHFLSLPAVTSGRGSRFLAGVWALATLARRVGAALLHSDAPRTALYAGLAARLARRRHLWHVRASIASSAFSDRLLLSLSDRVVAVSNAAARRSRPLRASHRVDVVRTGIEPPAFVEKRAARHLLGLPQDRFVAGVVGRVEPDKGGDDAVSALPALRQAVPGARLAFLGRCDPAGPFAVELRGQAGALGVGAAVDFLGAHDDAARLLKAFDLILHPSRHEALPRVLIEALFAAVPVVAAAVGGVPEVIEDQVSGILTPRGDAGALGAQVAALARQPERRQALSAAGVKRAAAWFTLDAMGGALLSIYESMLDRKPLARAAGESMP